MSDSALTIHHFAELCSGVWNSTKDIAGLHFNKKTLVYGPNGSGKTTLSRIFSSVQRLELEEALPDQTAFKIVLSDKTNITQALNKNPFGKNLLIYNTEFVARNIKWNTSHAEGIAYLSEAKIALKEEYEKNKKIIIDTGDTISQSVKELKEAETALKDFKTKAARDFRDIPGIGGMTQRYDATKIDAAYKECYGDEHLLDAESMKRAKAIVAMGENYAYQNSNFELPEGLRAWFATCRQVSKTSFRQHIIEDLVEHGDIFTCLDGLLNYHKTKNLQECLFCGNPLSEERKENLQKLFDESWFSSLDRYQRLIGEGDGYRENLWSILQVMPVAEQIVNAERKEYQENKEKYVELVKAIDAEIKVQVQVLVAKRENPTREIVIGGQREEEELLSVLEQLGTLTQKLESAISAHNQTISERKELKQQAYEKLEKHNFALHQEEWTSLKNRISNAEKVLNEARDKMKDLEHKHIPITNSLFDHGEGADSLNRVIWDYLGHKGISLVSCEGGYKIVRSGEEDAKNLSEGEQSAIAFCYFLTLLGADDRRKENLVVIIDDPVSSLDTTARTRAFSLMMRMTSGCAQTIILTHNMELMNMIKRRYQSEQRNDEDNIFTSFMQLNTSIDNSGMVRETKLEKMHPLLSKFESEYHYLFNLVYKSTLSEGMDNVYVLPNVTRKLLEMFMKYCAPEATSFAGALMSYQEEIGSRVNVRALERLLQIESHGEMDGLGNLPELSWRHASEAASEALKFIEIVDVKHYTKMKRICDRCEVQ